MKYILCCLLLIISSVANSAVFNTCSWNNPGSHPYLGGSAGVENYPDIPKHIRKKLADKIEKFQHDKIVYITKDKITGGFKPEITDMHFGRRSICREVDRTKWKDDRVELGLVFCEGEYCLLSPTICRNISRIRKLDDPSTAPFLPPSNEKGTMEELEKKIVREYGGHYNPPKKYHEIPEPNSLYLMLAGLIASFYFMRKKL